MIKKRQDSKSWIFFASKRYFDGFTLGHKTLPYLHLAESSPAAQCFVHHWALSLLHRRGEAAERSKYQGRGSFKQNFSLGSLRSISKEKQDLVHGRGACRELSVNSCKARLFAADNRSAHSAWPLVHGKSKKTEICSGQGEGNYPTFSKCQTTTKLLSRHRV